MAKRVYFAFHYQDVIDFRANVVRKHNFTEGVTAAGYYDSSIWEEARNTNPLSLKRLINAELSGTSVTAVLIGSDTWARRWVRYEIFKSIEKGNRVIGVHINSIKGTNQSTKQRGYNPFDALALEIDAVGTSARPVEWKNQSWAFSDDVPTFSINQLPLADRGKTLKLSHWLKTYDWINDRGYDNFSRWIV